MGTRYFTTNILEYRRCESSVRGIVFCILILIKNCWAPLTCAYVTLRQSVANLTFCNASFNFATAILKFDTFSIVVPYYYIIVRKPNREGDRLSLFLPFWN
jgi:hypothetical protein